MAHAGDICLIDLNRRGGGDAMRRGDIIICNFAAAFRHAKAIAGFKAAYRVFRAKAAGRDGARRFRRQYLPVIGGKPPAMNPIAYADFTGLFLHK